jgi:hypothetical protein
MGYFALLWLSNDRTARRKIYFEGNSAYLCAIGRGEQVVYRASTTICTACSSTILHVLALVKLFLLPIVRRHHFNTRAFALTKREKEKLSKASERNGFFSFSHWHRRRIFRGRKRRAFLHCKTKSRKLPSKILGE